MVKPPGLKEATFNTHSTAIAQPGVRNGNIRGMQLSFIAIASFPRLMKWMATTSTTITEFERSLTLLKIEDLVNIPTPGCGPEDLQGFVC
jgi:hypothetical protein